MDDLPIATAPPGRLPRPRPSRRPSPLLVQRPSLPSGFTLIEVMISIAILAILMAVPLSIKGTVQWLNGEEDYRHALRNAQARIEALRTTPCRDLPPRVVRVPADGAIRLDQEGIIPGTVTMRTVHGVPLESPAVVDAARGGIQTTCMLAGQDVIVDYRLAVPDAPEAVTVPSTGDVAARLHNSPVTRLCGVTLLQGDGQQSLSLAACKPNPAGTVLSLPTTAAGHAVLVEYVGGRIRNEVSGTFLDGDLRPTTARGPYKLMRVEERYGGDQVRLRLSTLRAVQ